jgi:DNA primase
MREHVLALLQRHLPGSVRPGAGGNVLMKCPFHKGGQEVKPSFSVNIDLGVFHCFTCHTAGNIGYMLRLLGLSRAQIDQELAAIKPELDANRQKADFEKQHFFQQRDPFKAQWELPETLLGVYEWCPSQLLEQGFSMELLRDFEVGFDRLGQRITYPLRDMYGTLAGIAGGRTLPQQEPKYKVYQGGYRDEKHRWIVGDFGEWFDEQFPGFKCENHDFLWNYHRVYPRLMGATSEADSSIFLVEGYKACLWMAQCGYQNTVALMGSYVSETQQRMLHRLGGWVYLFFDNDKAGREATKRIGRLLWRPLHGRLKVVPYPVEDVEASLAGEGDSQPDDYETQGVHQMVGNSLAYHVYTQQRSSPQWR